MPERNVALLEATLQQIKDHPDQHFQAVWAIKRDCGTAMCFAGWANHLSGWQPVDWYTGVGFGEYARSQIFAKDGEEIFAGHLASRLLGLTTEEADILFHAENTVAMLERMVKDLANGQQLGTFADYWEQDDEEADEP